MPYVTIVRALGVLVLAVVSSASSASLKTRPTTPAATPAMPAGLTTRPTTPAATPDLVIRNARVIHGDGRVTPRASVTIAGGRITAIIPATASEPGAAGVRVIDARGLSLMPGLIDAHVHARARALPQFLAYGVTTVRDLHNAADDSFPSAAHEDAEPGRPSIVASGPALDGEPPLPGATVIRTMGDARAAVRRLAGSGARAIATGPHLEPALFSAVVADARARGLPVAAYPGERASALTAAQTGVASLEHLSGIVRHPSDWARLSRAQIESLARDLARHRVTLVPTLTLHEARRRGARAETGTSATARLPVRATTLRLNPTSAGDDTSLLDEDPVLAAMGAFVAAYVRAGGRVAAGTNAGADVQPGASLHRELELYVRSGLSPAAALRTATVDAARLLGVDDRAGTVDVGKNADLVIVDGDPLADIAATRRIRYVIKAGIVVRE